MDEAQYVGVVASITGWTEEYIRWELPLCRGWSYYHTARLLDGERCRWAGARGDVDAWLDGIREKFKR